MIHNIIYTRPDIIAAEDDVQIIYTNSINKTLNKRYALLRSDLVIIADNNKDLEKECDWLKIDCINLKDISKLDNKYKRFYISVENDRNVLNQLFSIIKPLAELSDISIIAEDVDSPAIKLGKAIKERL